MITNDLYLKNGRTVFGLNGGYISIVAEMPIIVGKLFMEINDLSQRIHYKAPIEGAEYPKKMYMFAFEELMQKYLKEENFLLALEAYKYMKFYGLMIGEYHFSDPYDELMITETLKRYPNFDLNEEQYKTFLKTEKEKAKEKAPKEILDSDFIRYYIEDFLGQNNW